MKPPPKEEAALAGGLGEKIPDDEVSKYSRPSIDEVWSGVNPLWPKHIDDFLEQYAVTGDARFIGYAREIYLGIAKATWPMWLAKWITVNAEDESS